MLSSAAWLYRFLAVVGERVVPGGVCRADGCLLECMAGEPGAEGRSRAPLPQGLERPCIHMVSVEWSVRAQSGGIHAATFYDMLILVRMPAHST